MQQGYTFSPSYQGQVAGKWLYVKVGDLNAHGNTKYLDKTLTFAFWLPSIEVQKRIVAFLDATAREIALLYLQVEALRKQKRGLMQKLLTGQWRLPLTLGDDEHV